MNATSSKLHLPVSCLAAAILLLLAGSAQASPVLKLGNGKEPITRLLVGDHLAVGLAGGGPFESYQLRLLAEDGLLITAGFAQADAAGEISLAVLWPYSGVVGCDAGSNPDPATYAFEQFAEAEAALDGRTFQVKALNEDGVLAASASLPMLVVPHEIFYFSDAAGCLRQHLRDDEDVYMSLYHPERAASGRRLFLTPAGPLIPGDAIAEARRGTFPESWTLPDVGDPAVIKVWDAADTGLGAYDGICRWESSASPTVLPSDLRTGPGAQGELILSGILITIDGCPDCGRWTTEVFP